MQQIINKNIQPVVYQNKNYPLAFAYIIPQSAILNSNPAGSDGSITVNNNFCLPKGLVISSPGPEVSVTKNISSLIRMSGIATATSSGHGLSTGNTIAINGASPQSFNGSFPVTVTNANTFTYNSASTTLETATGTISFSATVKTSSNVPVKPDLLVWITGKGAYITKEGAWLPVPEITNLINNSTKIYTTNNTGSYLVFDPSDIADPFNQIKQLITNEGYLIVSNKPGQIPNYVWYDIINQDLSNYSKSKISFVYKECNSNIDVDNNQKVVKLNDIDGACDTHKKAGFTFKVKLEQLRKTLNYRVRFENNSDATVIFKNEELYYGNNQIPEIYINNDVDIINNLRNNVVSINAFLYENDTLVSQDIVSIYVNCPDAPIKPKPPLIKPRFYLVGGS